MKVTDSIGEVEVKGEIKSVRNKNIKYSIYRVM